MNASQHIFTVYSLATQKRVAYALRLVNSTNCILDSTSAAYTGTRVSYFLFSFYVRVYN